MTLPSPRHSRQHLVPRAFTVLACALLVASLALATLLPSDMSLQAALNELDPSLVPGARQALASGIWNAIVLPLLLRPSWLVPVCLGLVCVGAAISAGTPPSRRTTRRRS